MVGARPIFAAVILSWVLVSAIDAQPASKPSSGTFKPEEIDALVAPIALYPDTLLSQIFMAASYPIEVVQADRWVKANPDLKGDAQAAELEKQSWDPSVKSLVNFPQVLSMMSDKLDWTVKLGDAFIGQQQDVMNAVQKLRAKAHAEGNLKSNDQQTVTVEPSGAVATATAPSAPAQQIITIQPANPQVIYVPTYNPTVVYGSWPYPYYPPYYYYPPGYVARPGVWFGAGFACGMAWGYAWGNCNWGHHDVDIDINKNININNTHIDRAKYQNQFNRTDANIQGNRSTWQHDASHRQGVAYRDPNTAQRYGGMSSAQASSARQEFRGREASGSAFQPTGGVNRPAPSNNPPNRTGGSNIAGQSNYQRPSGAGSNYQQNRSSYSGQSSAFSDVNRGGSQAKTYSQRGAASRGYSGGGGAPRGGGGGARGGGGRR